MSLLHAIAAGIVLIAAASAGVNADMQDDPVLWKITFTELALHRYNHVAAVVWDAQAWLGKDRRKLVLKSHGKRESGMTEETRIQLLYAHAITPFWDLQIGWQRDIRPAPARDWAVLGFEGLAAYFVDTEIALFISENGGPGLRIEAEREWALGQRTILLPEFTADFYGFNDAVTRIGSGLSELELGLRLHYLLDGGRRAPYFGVQWKKRFGNSASQARNRGDPVERIEVSAGLSFWF